MADIRITKQDRFIAHVRGISIKGRHWILKNMSHKLEDFIVIQTEHINDLVKEMNKDNIITEER